MIALTYLAAVCAFFYKSIFFGQMLVPADFLGYLYPWRLSGIYLPLSYNPDLCDTILSFYPLMQFSMELVKKCIFPLWNPYIYLGAPLLAENEAFSLSPISILSHLLLPMPKAFTFSAILGIFLAGVFMYLFLKKGLRLTRFSAFAGGLIYMFNGHFIVWLESL